jgi:hypothetical protein
VVGGAATWCGAVIWWIKINKNKNVIKKHTLGPNDASKHIVWAFFGPGSCLGVMVGGMEVAGVGVGIGLVMSLGLSMASALQSRTLS